MPVLIRRASLIGELGTSVFKRKLISFTNCQATDGLADGRATIIAINAHHKATIWAGYKSWMSFDVAGSTSYLGIDGRESGGIGVAINNESKALRTRVFLDGFGPACYYNSATRQGRIGSQAAVGWAHLANLIGRDSLKIAISDQVQRLGGKCRRRREHHTRQWKRFQY